MSIGSAKEVSHVGQEHNKKVAGMCNLLSDAKENAESTEQRTMTEKAEAYSALRSAKLNKQGIEKETLEMLSLDEEETKGFFTGIKDEEAQMLGAFT